MSSVGLVGLGKISRFHQEALAALPDLDLVGGVDLHPGRDLRHRGESRPVFRTVAELLDLSPDVVAVATPTPAHHATCLEILEHKSPPRRLIIEKPVAVSWPQVQEIVDRSQGITELVPVYHAAHAPEVVWAAGNLARWRRSFGEITEWTASFADPYRDMPRAQRDRVYVNSWFDSGINALSVGLRLVPLDGVTGLRCLDQDGSRYEVSVTFGGGTGTIRTSWDVAEAAKSSEFRLASGARLSLDHQGISGLLDDGTGTRESFGYDGPLARLTLHYRNAFTSILVDDTGYHDTEHSLLLHRLLFSAG